MTRKQRFTIVLAAGGTVIMACALGGYLQLAGTIGSATPQAIPGRFHAWSPD
jgi:hypothetical protein